MRVALWGGLVAAVVVSFTGCATAVPVPAIQPYGAVSPPSFTVAQPRTVSIPSIGASSSLVPLGLDADGGHEVPPVSQPGQAGWYAPGYEPGEAGPAIILGHVDGGGERGVFYDLKAVVVGDLVNVDEKTFLVYRVESAPKDDFPADRVYDSFGEAEIRLITCGGAFSGESYVENVIVYARLL